MLQRSPYNSNASNTITYSIYAANKIYDENEGYQLGFIGSASFSINGTTSSSINNSWITSATSSNAVYPAGIYFGGSISGSKTLTTTLTRPELFTGSFQEIRYFGATLSTKSFYDYVMNPQSITGLIPSGTNSVDGSGNLIGSSYGLLAFRAPLGSELETRFTPSSATSINTSSYSSYHPAISGSYPTSSFLSGSSSYKVLYYPISSSLTSSFTINNYETYYYAAPIIGTKNKTSQNIQIVSPSYWRSFISICKFRTKLSIYK